MSTDLKQTVSTNPQVQLQVLEGESVLLHVPNGTYFGLDEVGTRVWELLAALRDLEAVFEQMLREYGAEPGRRAADLQGLIHELQEQGLVDVAPSEAA